MFIKGAETVGYGLLKLTLLDFVIVLIVTGVALVTKLLGGKKSEKKEKIIFVFENLVSLILVCFHCIREIQLSSWISLEGKQ